ncbi:MAG: 30S ribosomal protein S7 [Patescibacteria group bacterium]
MAKRIVPYVPTGSDLLVEKFISCIMMQGKKSIARRIFQDALGIVKTRTKENPLDVFNKAILNSTPLLEVRPRRVGGAVYQVPVEVTTKRQQSLPIRWLVRSARERKTGNMAERLALELLDAASEHGGAVKKKEDLHKMAQANKAFAHLAKANK